METTKAYKCLKIKEMKATKIFIISLLTFGTALTASAQRKTDLRNNNNQRYNERYVQQSPSHKNMAIGRERNYQVNPQLTTRTEPARNYVTNRPQMRSIAYKNQQYYYNSGIYYRYYNNNYVRIAPPFGLRISILPAGYVNITMGNQMYYYYEGAYYTGYPDNYVVVTPPMGAIVAALPVNYERVNVNGAIFYEYNRTLYQKVFINGQPAYQVAGYV